ncbi:MAG: tautomerase family protein [Magnetospirillum sp.]|nr:tautomerase family protein [Magnetospirillum sp.]
MVHLLVPHSMPQAKRQSVSEGVHQALADTLGVPGNGMFQLITAYDETNIAMSPDFLGVPRGPNFVFIQISVMNARTNEEKRALMRAVRTNLAARAGLGNEDMMINLAESDAANWFCVVK